jgi:hypothetical protein
MYRLANAYYAGEVQPDWFAPAADAHAVDRTTLLLEAARWSV